MVRISTVAGRCDAVLQWTRDNGGVSDGDGHVRPDVDPALVRREIETRATFGLYDHADAPWRGEYVRAQDNLNADLSSLYLAESKPEKLVGPELERWVRDVTFQRELLARRRDQEADIGALADELTTAPEVREALVWALRHAATKGQFDKETTRAHILSFRPHEILSVRLPGRTRLTVELRGRHLDITTSDDLVKRWLNGPLAVATAIHKFNALFRANNDYAGYLEGRDLSLAKDFEDPDYLQAARADREACR